MKILQRIVITCLIMASLPAAAQAQDSTSTSEVKEFIAPPSPDEGSMEVRAFRFLNTRVANPAFDWLMPLVTDFKRSRIVLIIIWALLVIFGGNRGRWAALMLIPLVAATDQLSATVIKPLAGRSRPCEVLGAIRLWHGHEGWITTPAEVIRSYKSSFSFPSSHATNITGAMLFLGLTYRKVLWPLVIVAAAVSYSRVYIGVHWTSDVLAGAAIGAVLGYAAWIAFRKLYDDRRPGGSGDENGADGLLDDPGRGRPEEEISDTV